MRAESVCERGREGIRRTCTPGYNPQPPLIHTPTLHTCAHIQTQSTFHPFPTPKSHTTSSLSHTLKSQRSAGREGEEERKSKRERGPSERETLVLNSSVLLPGLEALPTKWLSVVGVGFREGQWEGDVGHLHGFHLIFSTAG